MALTVTQTALPEVLILEPKVFGDGRGFFYESFNARDFQKATSLTDTEQERRRLKRRHSIEPIIGHLKSDHRIGRYHLKGAEGDAIHAALCAAGSNIHWLMRIIRIKAFAFYVA